MKPERTPQQALRDQLHRLTDLCRAYDSGSFVTMDIAVALRTLFCDGPNNGRNISVLTLSGIRDNVKLLDSTAPRKAMSFFNIGDNVSGLNITCFSNVYGGLVCKDITIGDENEYVYQFSTLVNSSVYKNYQSKCIEEGRFLSVKEWLDGIVFEVDFGEDKWQLSRFELFTFLANKDGGAHYELDMESNPKCRIYNEYRDTQALHLIVNAVDVCFKDTPIAPSVRQIAQEVLVSLASYL